MAKRFTDSEKWERPWYRALPLEYREFWNYICAKCDQIGIWYVDFKLASYMIGAELDPDKAKELLSKQVDVIGDGSRWLIKDFVSFQYGDLSPNNRFHQSLSRKLKAVKKEGVDLGVSTPLTRGLLAPKDKDIHAFKSLESLKTLTTESDTPAKRELTDVQKVVTVFKLCQGVDKGDTAWDKVYFSRFAKPAKVLIELLGDWRTAGDCVQDVYEKLTSKGLTVTLETVIKHATEWRKDRSEKEASRGVLPVSGNGSR